MFKEIDGYELVTNESIYNPNRMGKGRIKLAEEKWSDQLGIDEKDILIVHPATEKNGKEHHNMWSVYRRKEVN